MTNRPPTTVSLLIPTLDRSGAEKQLVQLACGLPRDEFQVEVIALTRGGSLEQELDQHGITLTLIGKRHRLDLRALRQLKRHLAFNQPNLLHTWLFAANSYGRLAQTASPATRVIVSERCVDSWKSRWQLWLDRRLIPRTDWFLANSNSVAEFYRSVGVPGERIEVIANGIDAGGLPLAGTHPENHQRRRLIREEFGLPPETVLVTCVGRLAAQKRIKDLVWAIELLGHQAPTAHLLIVGDGTERDRLKRFAEEIRCEQRVHFAGHRDDVPEIVDIRGPGFMNAVEFNLGGKPSAEFAGKVRAEAQKRGLLLLTCGVYGNVIRFLSPITIQDGVFTEALGKLEESIRAARKG